MKSGHLDTAIKTELGHINIMFHWFINLKMNVDYKTALICAQPILDSMVSYLMVLERIWQDPKIKKITWLSAQLAKSLSRVTGCQLHECQLALH